MLCPNLRLHQALQEGRAQGRHGLSGRDLQALALRAGPRGFFGGMVTMLPFPVMGDLRHCFTMVFTHITINCY